MLTSTRKETTIRSALHHTFKTDPGMLPQFQALEGSPADTPGPARNGANPDAELWRKIAKLNGIGLDKPVRYGDCLALPYLK